MDNKRSVNLDLVKAIAAFMICFYHLAGLNMGKIINGEYFININRIVTNLCAVSVPVFFMVNGALTLRRELTIKKYFFRIIKQTFIYITASILVGTFYIFINKNDYSVNNVLIGSGYLWFLRTLIIIYIILPILKLVDKNKALTIIFIVILAIFPFGYNYISTIAKSLYLNSMNYDFILKTKDLPRTGVFTMYSLLYYFMGAKLYNNKQLLIKNKISYIIIFFIGLVLVTVDGGILSVYYGKVFDSVNGAFPTIGALLMSIGLFLLINDFSLENFKFKNIIVLIGKNSLGIYILHMPLINLFRILFPNFKYNIIYNFIISLFILIISIILYEIWSNVKNHIIDIRKEYLKM